MHNVFKQFNFVNYLMYGYALIVGSVSMSHAINNQGTGPDFKENKSIEQIVEGEKSILTKDSIQVNLEDIYTSAKKEFESKKVPVLMFHNFDKKENRYTISPENFKNLLADLHDEDFYSISLKQYISGDFSKVPVGKKPVLFTFDDASDGQFMLNPDSSISKNSAVGILEDFYKENDFGHGGVFFVSYGTDKKFRLPFMQNDLASYKMKMLVDMGYDLGHHTIVHSNNSNASQNDIFKQHTLSAAVFDHLLSKDYADKIEVESFAHPFGAKPANKQVFDYLTQKYDLVFNAWGGTSNHPRSSNFDPYAIPRIEMTYHTKNLVLDAQDLYAVTPQTHRFYALENAVDKQLDKNRTDENSIEDKRHDKKKIKKNIQPVDDKYQDFDANNPLYASKKLQGVGIIVYK